MIKEMYVSSTPHETKVAVAEDDQLAEIFFERENEYTLAGSIYKGRVTRVLPGMQSAFVDIGLERDAFLYVSDFLDLGELDEDEIEQVPIRPETYVTNRPPQQQPEPKSLEFLKPPVEAHEADFEADEVTDSEEVEVEEENSEADLSAETQNGSSERQFRGGRRRRRGRRGRGFPETKFARTYAAEPEPEEEAAPAAAQPEYEPIVLPGESISKYRRNARTDQQASTPPVVKPEPPAAEPEPQIIIEDQLPPASGLSLLPGESLRKYRKEEPVASEDPITAPVAEPVAAEPVAAEPVPEPIPAEASVSLLMTQIPAVTEEHPAPAPQDVISPFMLPGESIRKYQAREQAQPDSPSREEQSIASEPESPQPVVEKEPTQPVVEKKAEPEAEPTEASVRLEGPATISPFVLPGESIRKYNRKRRSNGKFAAEEKPVVEAEEQPTLENQILGAATDVPEAEQVVSEAGSEDDVPSAEVLAAEEPTVEESEAHTADIATQADTEESEPAAEVDAAAAESEDDTIEPASETFEAETNPTAVYSGSGVTDEIAPEVAEDELTPEAELAESRPHITEDEHVIEVEPEAPYRRVLGKFEPAERGTLEHEEMEAEELPDDEHDFREVSEVGMEEDGAFEDLEETTLAPQAAEAVNDERVAEPFVIEGGYDFDDSAAEVAESEGEIEGVEGDEDEFDEADAAQEEAEASIQPGTRQAPRRFDRRRGRRGSGPRRGNVRPRRDFQRQNIQISDLLKEGQEVLIQIAKEPIGKKGARITSHIALPGRFLVYMPTVNHVGVSRKINSEEERQRLKRIMLSEREGGHGGFIVRTAAAGVGEDELRADIRFLKNLWHEIKTRSDNSKAPALIYHDLNLVERVLRDQVTSDFSAIWVDNEQEYERILRFANRFQPALVRKVKLYTKDTPLFEQFGIQEEINKALKSKVWLKSGGYIVINQTEALVAIDINTGKYVGKTTRLEDTIVKTNIDAIKEIVRQIRLRDLGGIIVIDFIDMDERKNRQKVMQALEEALKADRAPSKVLQFNDFGLVAITRKRVKQSLERTLGAPCPYCSANGFVKSVTTMCNEIFIEARKLTRQLDKDTVMLRCNPEVAKAIKAGRWVNEMEEVTGRSILIKPDPLLHTEQFDFN